MPVSSPSWGCVRLCDHKMTGNLLWQALCSLWMPLVGGVDDVCQASHSTCYRSRQSWWGEVVGELSRCICCLSKPFGDRVPVISTLLMVESGVSPDWTAAFHVFNSFVRGCFFTFQASVSPRVTSVDAFPPSIHTANILHFTNTSKFFQKNVGKNIFFHPGCSFLFVSNVSIRSCPGWDARVGEGSMKKVRVGVWDKNNVGEMSHLAHIHSIKRTCYLLYWVLFLNRHSVRTTTTMLVTRCVCENCARWERREWLESNDPNLV